MSEVVRGDDRLLDEFDEVTAEVRFPPVTASTTDKEFITKAGNGYMVWVASASVLGICGFALFIWGLYEIAKVL